jgi:hypothetical protein
MSWLDSLTRKTEVSRKIDEPPQRTRATAPYRSQPTRALPPAAKKTLIAGEVKRITVQTRAPVDDADPGAVAEYFYGVDGGTVFLCDQDGVATGSQSRAGDNPQRAAYLLARQQRSAAGGSTDFNRPLYYAKTGNY